MGEVLEQLIDSLLYEGYALYPYTATATKNSTPTPFGIAYPPAYAAALASTFDHLELRCVLEAPPQATIEAEVRFLSAGGGRHETAHESVREEAAAHRLRLPDMTVGALAGSTARERTLEREGEAGDQPGGPLLYALRLTMWELAPGAHELALRVENRTPCPHDLDRAAALGRSLLSTHPIVRVRGGRLISPLERPCASVNTFPVLASEDDDAVIGATIVLPDHPRIAPESRGGLFDSTEIEEALLLHVRALSDAEREQIERDDPLVREVVARAAAVTPEEILALHGRVTLRDPPAGAARSRVSDTPPREPPGLLDPTAGEDHADVDGVRFRRGDKVRLCPARDADLHARLLDGHTATIERIMVDYDGKTHFGVTVDADPGQELLRETGRLLFFFAGEVEVLA
jgi:hypothetical protein